MLGHEFTRKRVGVEGRSFFPPSRWKTERLSEKTPDPVFIVIILGCKKHSQRLIVFICQFCVISCFALYCRALWIAIRPVTKCSHHSQMLHGRKIARPRAGINRKHTRQLFCGQRIDRQYDTKLSQHETKNVWLAFKPRIYFSKQKLQ